MIDELVDNVSGPKKNGCGGTHESTVFPEPAAMCEGISKGTRNENDKHTKTMDPKKAAGPLPLLEHIALCKPSGSAIVMRFAGDVMVRPWIWRGQPSSNVLLQLVT
jgi:hypothetical protein